MAVGNFDWHSPRAQRARLGKSLSAWVAPLAILGVLLGVGGITLLFAGFAAGWLFLGLVAPIMMTLEWHRYELHSVPRTRQGERADDLLDADVLALLPEQPMPKSIAEAVASTVGGHFFAVRFGVSGTFLRELVSDQKEDGEEVFAEALRIAKQTDSRVSAGVLILALLRQVPETVRKTLLGHLQLEEDDIVRGITWYHHLDDMVKGENQRKSRDGGIGRDWSFGWIPNLSHFGINISRNASRPRPDVRPEALQQLLDAVGPNSGAIALVGKVGVGKTELVYEFADVIMHPDERVPKDLQYRQVFLLSASRLLSAANQGDALGSLVTSLLGEAFRAKNVIVCLDNAELFMERGPESVDILATLLPIFEAKRVPIIMTLDEQRYLQVARRSPELVAAVRRINVQPTSESDTLKILEDKVPSIEYQRKVTFMYQALKESYALGKRYVYDIAMPAQAVSLLESAAEYAEDGLVSGRSVSAAIEATIGVKTAKVDDGQERELLLNLETELHKRMVGQNRAVDVVSDALRRARAGVRTQSRPVGTFLFLGPTGVGKTELAKSLADVYFGGEDKMIRLDMNEFVSSDDVSRLIADASEDANSLTAQVMKQPFSVVLLDEIEKAHSSVLTTLLQLLDEGILRDARNREVSFRDAIIIATSNAGADRVQEYVHRGYNIEQFEEEFINELIGGHVFHPEFLNRFDEMVVFAPLEKAELLQVVDHILASINKNLEQQNITVEVAQDAKEYLVEKGYDPRLGARPMRRVVQRAVESTVAKQLLSQEVTAGGTIELTKDQIVPILERGRQADAIVAGTEVV